MTIYSVRPARVYVPNKSFHDFSKARRFGELVFLTEGIVNRTAVNDIARRCHHAMADCEPFDYLMITSLSIIISIASGIMVSRHGRINFLIHDKETNDYFARSIVISTKEMEDEQQQRGLATSS